MSRRQILQSGSLGLLAVDLFPSAARALQGPWLGLRETVKVPAASVAEPWQSAGFAAWLTTGSGDRLLRGELLRIAADEGGTAGLVAFCSVCPHEICYVEMVRDTTDVPMDEGQAPNRPLLVCPCHFSVFDPVAGGASISGPSHRGLYAFDVERSGATIRIGRVEAAVTALFA